MRKKEQRGIRQKMPGYRADRNAAELKREKEAKRRALQKRKQVEQDAADQTLPEDAPLAGEARQSNAWKARRIDPAVREKALKLMRAGMGPRQVSEKLGVTYTTVCCWRRSCPDFVIKRRKKPAEELMEAPVLEKTPVNRKPKPPAPQADRMTRYCYLIDYVNWARRKEGLSSISYGDLQAYFDRYKKWLPKNYKEMLK